MSTLSLLNFGGAHFDKKRMFKLGGRGGKAEEMEKKKGRVTVLRAA